MKPDIYEIIGDLLDTNKPNCLERYNKVKDYINSLEQYIEVLNNHISFYESTDKALAYFRFNNGNPRYNRSNLTPEEEQTIKNYSENNRVRYDRFKLYDECGLTPAEIKIENMLDR